MWRRLRRRSLLRRLSASSARPAARRSSEGLPAALALAYGLLARQLQRRHPSSSAPRASAIGTASLSADRLQG